MLATDVAHRAGGANTFRLSFVHIASPQQTGQVGTGRANPYQGNVSSSLVRVGELFRDAVRLNAASVILVHNHPSGDPTPSEADIKITRDLIRAGQLMKIEVLDHVVIGNGSHCSLRERGVFWN